MPKVTIAITHWFSEYCQALREHNTPVFTQDVISRMTVPLATPKHALETILKCTVCTYRKGTSDRGQKVAIAVISYAFSINYIKHRLTCYSIFMLIDVCTYRKGTGDRGQKVAVAAVFRAFNHHLHKVSLVLVPQSTDTRYSSTVRILSYHIIA